MPDSVYPLPDEEGNIENNWVVHHLFPHISHVHYPKISPIIKEVTDQYGITYREQPTFLKAIGQHAKMLKLLGRKR